MKERLADDFGAQALAVLAVRRRRAAVSFMIAARWSTATPGLKILKVSRVLSCVSLVKAKVMSYPILA